MESEKLHLQHCFDFLFHQWKFTAEVIRIIYQGFRIVIFLYLHVCSEYLNSAKGSATSQNFEIKLNSPIIDMINYKIKNPVLLIFEIITKVTYAPT